MLINHCKASCQPFILFRCSTLLVPILDEFSVGFSNVPGRVRSHMQVAVPGTRKFVEDFRLDFQVLFGVQTDLYV